MFADHFCIFVKFVTVLLHMDVLSADSGELFSFGCNDEGQLGFDSCSEERVDVPTKLMLSADCLTVRMLSAGVYHSACLTGLLLRCCIYLFLFASVILIILCVIFYKSLF